VGQHHRLVSHPRKKRKKRTKPPEQWAYSVEFPVDRAELPLNAKVTFEVVVQRGSVVMAADSYMRCKSPKRTALSSCTCTPSRLKKLAL
jgi:hypothetical protein